MPRQAVVQADEPNEREREAALRPRWLREVIGQKLIVERLAIVINASRRLREPLPHILFDGPHGLGKTTLATVLPNEVGTTIQMTSGLTASKAADLLPVLTNAEDGSFLFIDEVHRLPRAAEEFIHSAMQDFHVNIVLGEGVSQRNINLKLKRFTVIGATTRSGLLSARLCQLFEIQEHFDLYTPHELAQLVWLNARKLGTEITKDAAVEIGRRSRGTPSVATAHLRWARKFAASEADGRITLSVAQGALDMAQVDREGLDKQDRRYLETLIGIFEGGPVGVEALAATMNLPADSLSDEVEPYLLREQFVVRTPRGRLATPKAYRHLGRPVKAQPEEGSGPALFH
jgi:Holliday junction DNA helicase RuvB